MSSKGRQLLFLNAAHLPGRIQQTNFYSRNTVKPLCHSAPGITRCSYQHCAFPVFVTGQACHRPGQETYTKLLERQRGPMTKFQRKNTDRKSTRLNSSH